MVPTKTGAVNLPLHGGKAPAWLFNRMKKLSREILLMMASEYGPGEILCRISDPLWFQALGCVLGFDWHSSGVTTTVCGALKEAIKGIEKEIGLHIAGGKGATSRKTPKEIEEVQFKTGNNLRYLIYSSKMTAKVDNNALQDGYQLYHHCFFFTPDGSKWAVIQQGMNEINKMARRYHWIGDKNINFICEPHTAICCNSKSKVMNLVAKESIECQQTITELATQNPKSTLKDFLMIVNYQEKKCKFPSRHDIFLSDIDKNRIEKILLSTYERKPKNFEELLSLSGVGPKTIRSLALISELVYGISYSTKDPARFSFAHGGKDGIPYPVNKNTYDKSIEILHKAIKEAKVEKTEKINAIKRLGQFYSQE